MAKNRKPLRCPHCGGTFARTPGAGLFCSKKCEKAHGAAINAISDQLTERGFIPHEAPNCWVKDGVAISIHQVKHLGIEKAMRVHASHVAGVKSEASEKK